ncbi:ChrR family anti-sigma-E factor [Tistlia consotensis]|nr:ChrR family anti-sigma-E factor [Tistlia consotensis]
MLLAYAAGWLDEPLSLVVESQAALNPESRKRLAAYEAIGGVLLDELPPAPLCREAIDRTLPRLDQAAEQAVPHRPAGTAPCGCGSRPRDGLPLPASLRRLVGSDLAALPWKWRMPGLSEVVLQVGGGQRVSLVRIAPGRRAPRHSHRGHEIALVLAGAFQDGTETYGAGDLQISDGTVDHEPRAIGDRPCICLTVLDAAVRLTGPFGRLLNPFIRG